MIGSVILIFGSAPLLSDSLGDFWSSAIFLPFGGVIWLILKVTRKYVLTPRIGVVKFSKARRTKLSQDFAHVSVYQHRYPYFGIRAGGTG